MNSNGVIVLAVIFLLIVAGSIFVDHHNAVQQEAVRNVATFGEQHTYENFVLKKGTCLRIKTETGDVLVCLPAEGKPTLLIAPELVAVN